MAIHRTQRPAVDPVRRAWDVVLAELRATLPHLPELRDFIGRPLPGPETYRAIEPAPMPVLARLPEARAATKTEYKPLINALIRHCERLHWIQSYNEGDGVDRKFLDNYAYLNVASEIGPFVWDGPRVMIGLWGGGITYDEHWHEPEEIYSVIGGGARFRSPGSPPRDVGPGDSVIHASNQIHATDMTPGPLLAVVAWRGDNLMKRADIGEDFGRG